MEKKITKKEMFANLYAVVEALSADVIEASSTANKAELLGFIDHEVELLEKKSSKVTMTATQKENIGVMETIKEVLAEKPNSKVSELITDERLSTYTNQKVSALLKKLCDAGEVDKATDKKVSRFSLKR